MNYIIDPKLVYWISVASAIKWFIVIIAASILVICAIALMMVGMDADYYEEEELDAKLKSVLRVTIVSISLIFISLFVPSKKTSIEMIVASKVTTESIQATKEEIYELIDYTVEKIYGSDNDE